MRKVALIFALLVLLPTIGRSEYTIVSEVYEKTNLGVAEIQSDGKDGKVGLRCTRKKEGTTVRTTLVITTQFSKSGKLLPRKGSETTLTLTIDDNEEFTTSDILVAPPLYWSIVDDAQTRDLVEQMKAGNSIKVRIRGRHPRLATIIPYTSESFSASLIGFTKASKMVLAACDQ